MCQSSIQVKLHWTPHWAWNGASGKDFHATFYNGLHSMETDIMTIKKLNTSSD